MASEHSINRQVACGETVIEYQLTRKKVKNINLRIKADGTVHVSANRRVPISYIEDFIRRKQEYILNAQEAFRERDANKKPALPRKYEEGESFLVLGKMVTLKIFTGQPESVTVEGDILCLTVKHPEDARRRERLVNHWLKELQKEVFLQLCEEIYPFFQNYGVAFPTVKIRSMTSRWGSCQPWKGVITLNSRLIAAGRESIAYVVLHEFAHFIHPNHSRAFYELLTALMPDWKERKKALEEIVW